MGIASRIVTRRGADGAPPPIEYRPESRGHRSRLGPGRFSTRRGRDATVVLKLIQGTLFGKERPPAHDRVNPRQQLMRVVWRFDHLVRAPFEQRDPLFELQPARYNENWRPVSGAKLMKDGGRLTIALGRVEYDQVDLTACVRQTGPSASLARRQAFRLQVRLHRTDG